jgi:uncharacterized protein (DUF1800 family)
MPRIRLVRAMALAIAIIPASAGIALAQEKPSDHDEIVHVLNRITFGPCPGDVDAVQKMGVHSYIEQQLHPETIDDSAVEQQVAVFDLLQLSAPQLMQMFVEERKKALKKAKELADATIAKEGWMKAMASPPNETVMPPEHIQLTPRPKKGDGIAKMLDQASQYRSVAAIGQLEQAKLVRAVESKRQLQEVLVDFWGNHFNIDMKKGPDRVLKVADDHDVIRPHIWGTFRELLEASAKSPAMLWYLDNYLNSSPAPSGPFAKKMQEMAMQKTMGPDADPAAVAAAVDKKKRGRGPNENYAREIMELHTLGVDGGYTQKDVQEVARCFTGWSIERDGGTFKFRPFLHDNGEKVVLGHTIPAGGGMKDGEMVLDILASHPATAHHIALEMCQRFVSDDPSAALVDRIAGVFTQTGGDLRQVTEAILTSPEFLSPANYDNKIKSPLEFAVSAVRASGSTMIAQQPAPFDKIVPAAEGAGVLGRGKAADRISQRPRQSLNWHILELGEPLFACSPPTGYKEVSSTWVSPGALIERLNFALALTEQKVADIPFDPRTVLAGTDLDNPEAVLNQSVAVLLQNHITDSTRKVLEQTAIPSGDSKTINPNKLLALIIGSPEFQRK